MTTIEYKWSWWRRFMSHWKLFLYLDYSIRAKKQMSRSKRGERELRILQQFVDPTRAAIDVGANKGVYTYWLEKFSKKVYAYEANPALVYSFLREPRGNVEVRPFGVSNVTGVLKFRIPIAGMQISQQDGSPPYLRHQGGNFRSEPGDLDFEQDVKTYRLDDLEHDPIGFMKIDVEGHQMEVLEGAQSLIQRDRPVMMIEFIQNFHKRPITDLIRKVEESLGYTASVLSPIGSELVHPTDLGQKYFTETHQPFIKNIFFIPSEKQMSIDFPADSCII